MTLVVDVLRQQQRFNSAVGPPRWAAAWDRTLDLLTELWPRETAHGLGAVQVDGGAALATALYLIAVEQDIEPAGVTRVQVEALLHLAPGETVSDTVAAWERRLRAIGHDPDDPADPVAACWRDLRVDNSPDESLSDAVHIDHGSEYRWGPGVVEGLRGVLAPMYKARLRL
jgi:hypothetical protein